MECYYIRVVLSLQNLLLVGYLHSWEVPRQEMWKRFTLISESRGSSIQRRGRHSASSLTRQRKLLATILKVLAMAPRLKLLLLVRNGDATCELVFDFFFYSSLC